MRTRHQRERSRQGWCITADAVVGVLVFDHVRLTIEPKLAISGNQLVTWLRYVLATPVPHQPSHRRWQTSRNGITDLIASELVAACQELLRGGLRRDYVLRESIDSVLRGRLDLKPQIARRFGGISDLLVDTGHDADSLLLRMSTLWESVVRTMAQDAAGAIGTRQAFRPKTSTSFLLTSPAIPRWSQRQPRSPTRPIAGPANVVSPSKARRAASARLTCSASTLPTTYRMRRTATHVSTSHGSDSRWIEPLRLSKGADSNARCHSSTASWLVCSVHRRGTIKRTSALRTA